MAFSQKISKFLHYKGQKLPKNYRNKGLEISLKTVLLLYCKRRNALGFMLKSISSFIANAEYIDEVSV